MSSMLCSSLIGCSVLSAFVMACWPKHLERMIQPVSYLLMLLNVQIVVQMFSRFDTQNSGFQLVEKASWVPMLNMHYHVGVDGISLLLVALTVFATLLVVISQASLMSFAARSYLATFFLMQAVTVGVFMALDGVLFYLFWESTLIPMYLALGIWGSSDRLYASRKFFIFTFVGSLFLLLAIIYLGVKAGTFDMMLWYPLPLTMVEQIVLFLMFSAAFAIKVPMFPLHIWLPDAHTEAPAAGSVILAALLLKVGVFGFLRFNLPITPDASAYLAPYVVVLSLIAVMYIGMLALIQEDIKKLIAYASISHMGMVTLGIFAVFMIQDDQAREMALLGANVQMIAHAFSAGGLFMCFGMLYQRYHKRNISDYGGLASVVPVMTIFFVWFSLSNIGLPGTAGFVGELLIFLSTFYIHPLITFCALCTILLSASYTLWLIKRVFYGPLKYNVLLHIEDVQLEEVLPLTLLGVMVLVIGLYPAILTKYLTLPTRRLLVLSFLPKLYGG